MTRHLLPAFEFNATGEDDDDDIPSSGGKPIIKGDPEEYVNGDFTNNFRRVCHETRPHTHHSRPCTYEHVPPPRPYQPPNPYRAHPRPLLNEEFRQHLEDLNGLLLDHCKGVKDYALQLWGVYQGMLNGYPTHAILEATMKTQFLHGLDERFTEWREAYLRTKQIVPSSPFDIATTAWEEVVLDAIAEETRLDRLEARAVREAEAAAREEERQKAKVNEETISRTIRTFEDLPVSSIAESSPPTVVGTEQGGRRGPVFQDEVRQNIAPKLPRLEAWLEEAGLEEEEVVDIPDEEDEEEFEEEIQAMPVVLPEYSGLVVEETPSASEEEEEEEEVEAPPAPVASVLGRRRRTPLPPMPTGDHITVMWPNGFGVRAGVPPHARPRPRPMPRRMAPVATATSPEPLSPSRMFYISETDQEDNDDDGDNDDDEDEDDEDEDEEDRVPKRVRLGTEEL